MSESPHKPAPCQIQDALKRFEESLDGASADHPELLSEWKTLRSGLDEILEERSAPHVSRNLELPVILVATPEIVSLPEHMGNLSNFIRTGDGGALADISAGVVTELYQRGVNVHVTLPHYRNLFASLGRISEEEYRAMIRGVQEVQRIHFIDHGLFDGARQVYEDRSQLDRLMVRRAVAFTEGILYGLLPALLSRHDRLLVHCNDWMTGLLPSAARSRGIPSLITCHNIFTALETPHALHEQGIDVSPFLQQLYFQAHPDSFSSAETNYRQNRVDFLTSALFAASRINTVSPTFLREIAEDAFSDLDLVPDAVRLMIRQRFEEGAASGILNAPMPTADPHVDPLIHRNYDASHMVRGKRANKVRLQEQMQLRADPEAPILFWPHRLVSPQKGVELMLAVIPTFMAEHPTAQFAIVANGQQQHVNACQQLMAAFPRRVAYHRFSRELSQLGKAASDFILCPSLYEPCGIPQVEGPRYGTLPIARKTGGLADTVEPLTPSNGNGFVFLDYTKKRSFRRNPRGARLPRTPSPESLEEPATGHERERRAVHDQANRRSVHRTVGGDPGAEGGLNRPRGSAREGLYRCGRQRGGWISPAERSRSCARRGRSGAASACSGRDPGCTSADRRTPGSPAPP
jgi:ADP-glucose type glycogen/starch synthase